METKLGFVKVFCLCLLLVPTVQRKDNNFLDLTRKPPHQKQRSGTGRGGGMGPGGGDGRSFPVKIVPLKVVLLSLDKSSYQLGDQVIYEVTLENVTDKVLVIPWSVDYDRVKPNEEHDPPGYMWAYLSLVIKDEISGDQFMAGRGINGSQLLRGSLKRLQPGQRVRIRAKAPWSGFQEAVYKRVLAKLPQTFEVRADFALYDPAINPRFEPALSTNSLSVELRRRQQ